MRWIDHLPPHFIANSTINCAKQYLQDACLRFPSIRIGYIIAPCDLFDAFVRARCLAGHQPALEQAVLADFISEGHFARHIRRMRILYAERQQALLKAGRSELKLNPLQNSSEGLIVTLLSAQALANPDRFFGLGNHSLHDVVELMKRPGRSD